jgi:predicted ATP-dependent protease
MFILFLVSGFICAAMYKPLTRNKINIAVHIKPLTRNKINIAVHEATKKKQNKHSCTYKATKEKQNKHSLYVQLCLFCFFLVAYMYNYVYFVSL